MIKNDYSFTVCIIAVPLIMTNITLANCKIEFGS